MAPGLLASIEKSRDEDLQVASNRWDTNDHGEPSDSSPSLITYGTPRERPETSSLAEVFGYYGSNKLTTMALMRQV